MRQVVFSWLAALLLLLVGLTLFQVARSQGAGETVVAREFDGTNVREIVSPAHLELQQRPDIGFIDSPTVLCYQPDANQDVCHLNWYYMAVDASPNYIITMTVWVAPLGIVSRAHGFFQTSMYVPYGMLGDGFRVPCGDLGAGGNPALGNAYSYTIKARDSAGLGASNYGTAYCPAHLP